MRSSKKLLVVSAVCLGLGAAFSYAFADEVSSNSRRSRCETTPPSPAQKKCNEFTFDATGSYDPNNKKFDVEWDFGDGTTSVNL